MRSALFCEITHRTAAIPYRCVATNCRSLPEGSARNYNYMLCNLPKKRRSPRAFSIAGGRVMGIDVHSWCRYIYIGAYRDVD